MRWRRDIAGREAGPHNLTPAAKADGRGNKAQGTTRTAPRAALVAKAA